MSNKQIIKESLDELLSQIIEIEIIDDIHINTVITVAGWIDTIRKQKKLVFIKLSDSAYSRLEPLQIIFESSDDKEYFDMISNTHVGAAIIVKGLIVSSIKPGQKIEMQAQQYIITGDLGSEPDHYPLAGNVGKVPELLRDLPELECRSQLKSAIYNIRSKTMGFLKEFFTKEKYTQVDTPMLCFSECEGGCSSMQATLLLTSGKASDIPSKDDNVDFSKDFFKAKTSITVSSQLELETQLPLGNVWTVTRAVRGEPSQTSRHLCEFSMIEIEKRFSRSAIDIMDISEKCIKQCISYALDHCSKQMEFLDKFYDKDHISKLRQYVEQPFIRITHAEAITILINDSKECLVTFTDLPKYDEDMGSEHEKYLADVKYKHPVIVMRYPKVVKAFYMPVIIETEEESYGVEHVDSFDILVPGVGELVGGSQRIYKEDELVRRIDELGLDKEPLQFYINLRKYGSVPHGGMGMGFERLIAFITGADSVKDVVSFPKFFGSGKRV